MPGLKIRIDVNEAQKAVADLRKDLKALGADSTMTEKSIQGLESRLKKKMGADGADQALRRLSESLGLSKRETDALRTSLGEQLTTTEKAQRAYAGLKANWMALTGIAVGLWMAFSKVRQYLDMGAAAMKTEAAFESMGQALGANTEKILNDSKKATRGMIDDSDLMKGSLFAMTQDIDPEKIPALFEAARVASRMTGRDIADTAETIIDAVATDMPKGLKRMGMVTKEQMDIVNRAFAMGITDVKLYDMVVANAAVNSARLAASSTAAADGLRKFDVEIKELGETLGKGGLILLQKLFGIFQMGAANALLLAGSFARVNYEYLQMQANAEKDPVKKIQKQMDADVAKAKAEQIAISAGELGVSGVENVTGDKVERGTVAQRKGMVGEGAVSRRISDKAQEQRAIIAREKAENEAIAALQVKEQKKLDSELAKARQESNAAVADNALKTYLDLMKREGAIESEQLSDEAKQRKLNNEQYQKDALAAIAAEADAREAAEKYFPKDFFIKSKQQELAETMKVKAAEVESLDTIAKKAAIIERIEWLDKADAMAIENQNKARSSEIQQLTTIAQLQQQARDAEIDHQKKMLDWRVRYGNATPRAAVEGEYQAQVDKLQSDKKALQDEIKAKDDRLKPGVEGYEDWLPEKMAKTGAINNINKQIEQIRAQGKEALREFDENWWAGMASGFKVYSNQIGSEFQIWEQWAKDSAQAMQNQFSEFFFDAFQGKLKTLEDYGRSFGLAMGKAMSDALAKEITKGILKGFQDGEESEGMISGAIKWARSGAQDMLGLGGGKDKGLSVTQNLGDDEFFQKLNQGFEDLDIPDLSDSMDVEGMLDMLGTGMDDILGMMDGMDFGGGGGGGWMDMLDLLEYKKGAAFRRGNVIPFASGTVVDRPTLFPMANGNVGLMGEAGTEAVMPLARTRTGELGVRGTTQGSTINVPLTVIGGNKKQASEIRQAAEDAVQRVVKRWS